MDQMEQAGNCVPQLLRDLRCRVQLLFGASTFPQGGTLKSQPLATFILHLYLILPVSLKKITFGCVPFPTRSLLHNDFRHTEFVFIFLYHLVNCTLTFALLIVSCLERKFGHLK